jgi:hypothetical protein
MGGFQTQVHNELAPAVEGDFASSNPRSSVLAGPGGLVAGQFGAVVGRFGWVGPDFKTVDTFATGPVAPDGILHRNENALITLYLGIASMLIPQGFMVALFDGGDFWVKNLGPAALTKGATVYAGYLDGGAYSSAPSGASGTGSIGSTNTAAIGSTSTGSVVDDNPNQIDLTSVTGVISVGDTITGDGIPENTEVTAIISGTGGAGRYEVSNQITSDAATVTTFGNILVVSATTGLISIGDTVSGGSGFPVGATVVSQLPGGTTGGAGSYVLSAPATEYVASATGVTTFGNVLKATAVTGTLAPGAPITGTNMPATSIASQISGTVGGVGVYSLFLPATQYVASESFTTAGGIDSGWKAYPTSNGDGAVGSLVKVSKAVI